MNKLFRQLFWFLNGTIPTITISTDVKCRLTPTPTTP